jgi:glutamyl-tRNA reductase
MPLFSCGINHQSAPIDVRERLAFDATQTRRALADLCRLEADEAVVVSTCHRTEIYIAGQHRQALQSWLRQHSQAANTPLEPHVYWHEEEATVRHLLRVCSGLDSMVLGEPQIFGQMKSAYRLACDAGAAGPHFQQLFPAVFAASKTIRQETQIGAHPVSMAYAVVQLAKRIFKQPAHCCVLLIGVNELIELTLTHFLKQGVHRFIIANRTLARAQQLAQQSGGVGVSLSDIPDALAQADIVVSATASPLPIIGKGLMETTLKAQKRRRPILMVDLAVPRDIEPETSQLTDIYLYNIDDLQAIIDAHLKNRRAAAKQAEALVELQTEHYLRRQRIADFGDVITQFRERAEQQRDQALQKALMALDQGRDPQIVAHQLAHQLTNKILHQPTLKLRQLAGGQQAGLLSLAKQLFSDV